MKRPRTMRVRSVGKLWAAVAVLALVVSACGDVTKTEEYQALQAGRDAISEELDATATELESVNQRLATAVESLQESEADADLLGADLEATQTRAASLEDALSRTRDAIEAATAAADVDVFQGIWVTREFYDEMVDIGVPIELGDQALSLIGGRWLEWEEFADAPATFEWGELVRAVDDDATTSAWQRWYEAEISSDEEFRNSVEVDLRVQVILLQRLAEAMEAAATPPGHGS